jgi:fatty-acyl-CoA synthase
VATFAELVEARADDEHAGLRFEDETYTWARVVQEARKRAELALAMRNPERPFHIGVLLDNVPEYVFWIFGAALAGAAVVGVNPTRRGAELATDIRHTDCLFLITDSGRAGLLGGLDLGVPVLLSDAPDYLASLASLASREGASRTVPGSDPLLLLFTSGSTGTPKAVICSQARLADIGAHGGMFGIGGDSVTYVAMPLFHGNAVMANLAMATYAGATVALRRCFSASSFLPDIRKYGVTYFNYVGRALAYILATPECPDDGDNSLVAAFGTEASARDMAEFGRRFGCQIIEGYGSSEGVITISKMPGTPPDALGLAGDGMDLAVHDPVTGLECPRAAFDQAGKLVNHHEAIGEIVRRGATFEGYYNNPDADALRLRDGWYWSGDLGYRDENGYFYFAGRDADWLRVDSENFAAAPVERILARYAPVVMCAVYAVPDARTGDEVMATLELVDPLSPFDPERFAAFLREQPDLGTKWAPRFVRLTRAMPLTSTNKVDKTGLRRERWECADPVFWRPDRELRYVPMADADRSDLRERFIETGRDRLLF